MANFNKVVLCGNLTADPELRQIGQDNQVCKLRLALNRRYRTAAGEDREDVCYVDVDVWGRQAQSCGQYLRKGRGVLVEGRLKMDQWDDRATGQKRSRLSVYGENVQFLPGRDGAQQGGAGGGGYAPPQQQQGGYAAPAQQAAAAPQQQGPGNWGTPPPPAQAAYQAPQSQPAPQAVPPPPQSAPPPSTSTFVPNEAHPPFPDESDDDLPF
ncbi:MAG TPA: single-stranded DNA-binding protein [Lentisphaeria bacterium]|nr:single-stranded DNA-binding protein [Lentisphaeria bacterium]